MMYTMTDSWNGRRTNGKKTVLFSCMACALIAVAGLPAMAQTTADDNQRDTKVLRLQGDLNKPLKPQRGANRQRFTSSTTITHMDGNNTYTLTIVDGETTAEVNGKKVPQDRIRSADGRVEILDERGETLTSFSVSDDSPWGSSRGFAGAGKGVTGTEGLRGFALVQPPAPPAPDAPRALAYAMAGDPPPVMLGITFSNSDQADEEQDGIAIDTVIDGLPAAKSGLKSGDVIRELDGTKVNNRLALREVMKKKSPGDEMKVTFDRDGKSKTVTVVLEAYNQDRLGQSRIAAAVELDPESGQRMFLGGRSQKWHDDAVRAIEKAMRDIRENENIKPERFKAQLQQELERAMKALETAKSEVGSQLRMYMQEGRGGAMVAPRNFQPGEIVVTPAPAPSGQNDAISRKLDKLTDQLERLADRLEAMEKKLDQRGNR